MAVPGCVAKVPAEAEAAGVGGPGSYLWPWVAFMWSRMLMACLRSPSTLRK